MTSDEIKAMYAGKIGLLWEPHHKYPLAHDLKATKAYSAVDDMFHKVKRVLGVHPYESEKHPEWKWLVMRETNGEWL